MKPRSPQPAQLHSPPSAAGPTAPPPTPRPERCIQRYMIERWAHEQPEKIFAIFPDGEQWTYSETARIAARAANALRALGVQQGERVVVWLPNNADCLRVWFGLNYLG